MEQRDESCVDRRYINHRKDLKRLDVRGNAVVNARMAKLKECLVRFGIPRDMINRKFLEDIVSICQGKIWSEEFDNKSKDLAARINEEFDLINSYNKQ